jgi:outer membrane protein TolC
VIQPRSRSSPTWTALFSLAVMGGIGAAPPGPAVDSARPANEVCAENSEPFIDLGAALRLAGVSNPQILIARQRISEAVALRQFAAAQVLPTLQFGTSYDQHSGPLQQSNGNILNVQRSSLYFGAGASAVTAGSVSIPGVMWNLNVSQTIYAFLQARQVVEQRRFGSRAIENEMLRQVANAYLDLLGAEGRRSVAAMTRQDAADVLRTTESYVTANLGRKADRDRAATEFEQSEAALRQAEGDVLLASARLARLLNLDPSLRLHSAEANLVPLPVVPEPIPLCELLAIALLNRPELAEQRAAVREALLGWQAAKVLPFSPNILIGLSSGGEGGGSDLVAAPPGSTAFAEGAPRFGKFSQRMDFDVVAFWTLQNLGVGNAALLRAERAKLNTANLRMLLVFDQVRAEVANAHARVHVRLARIASTEQATKTSMVAFTEDAARMRGMVGKAPGRAVRPIELLDSLRLVSSSRYEYVRAIVEYNQAEVDLYVALGQPPADVLARPVPANFEKDARPASTDR